MPAFSNIRVIDLTHVLAGPFCTYQLGVMGADVIKIEPPDEPDMVRASGAEFPHGEHGLNTAFISQSANKRAIALNIKSDQGKAILTKLIETADVLVENYRSGALAKLGFGYEDVKQIKSDIIYCSMTGFGQHGPKGHHTAYDNVIQAFSGLMAANGTPEQSPVKVGPPILDYGTGIQAAFAISAALFQRSQTGKGQYIDIAMLDAALMLMSSNITYYDQYNKIPPNTGNQSTFSSGYACYKTKEGLIMIGAYNHEQMRRFWYVLGDPEYGDTLSGVTCPAMEKNKDEEVQRVKKLLMEKTAEQWEDVLNRHKVPAARVRTIDEALTHPQMQSRTVTQTVAAEPDYRRLPTASFKYAEDGPALTRKPPVFAEHTEEVLAEFGYGEDALSDMAKQGVIALPQ